MSPNLTIQNTLSLVVEFFTVNIRNKNTRGAYTRAAGSFLLWYETKNKVSV